MPLSKSTTHNTTWSTQTHAYALNTVKILFHQSAPSPCWFPESDNYVKKTCKKHMCPGMLFRYRQHERQKRDATDNGKHRRTSLRNGLVCVCVCVHNKYNRCMLQQQYQKQHQNYILYVPMWMLFSIILIKVDKIMGVQ